jgi:DNA polymerase-3 subunit delta
MLFGLPSKDEKVVASAIGVSPFFVKDYFAAANRFGLAGIENALLILHQYNLKSIGINNAATEDASLMKELIVKLI